MPTYIYRRDEHSNCDIASLCENDWELPVQIEALKQWLDSSYIGMPSADYVADIGFSVRADALGGGADLDPLFMKRLSELGVHLFLSEYPDERSGGDI